MAIILRGSAAANALTDALGERVVALNKRHIYPTLAIIRVGEHESDIAYERNAIKRATKIGILTKEIILPADCSEQRLIAELECINNDDSIHSLLMFRPLPKHIDENRVCQTLKAQKDVDCITSASLISVLTGRGDGYAPCTAEACLEILDYYGYELEGKNVAVIGRSMVIGKPVSLMLQSRNATVTMCHTKTQNMADICSRADIIVVASGHMNTVTKAFTNPAQVIIDVGINVDAESNIHGDVDFAAVEPCVAAITPVPGGVGSVTTAVLCKHVVEAAEKS